MPTVLVLQRTRTQILVSERSNPTNPVCEFLLRESRKLRNQKGKGTSRRRLAVGEKEASGIKEQVGDVADPGSAETEGLLASSL